MRPARLIGAAATAARIGARRVTAPMRKEPSFLIIGTMKGGTSSLYRYLCRHPEVQPAATKEVHYFDLNWDRPLDVYRSHFPLRGSSSVTGEASPYYLFHPTTPTRVAECLPDVQLIALLRNPVARAYSHYRYARSRGREWLSFEEALENEGCRLRGVDRAPWDEPGYRNWPHQHQSYLARGRYAEQLERWDRWFDRSQMFVARSEELFSDEQTFMDAVHEFLELRAFRYDGFRPYKQDRSKEEMSPNLRRRLREFYGPHNVRLREEWGRKFRWWS